MELPNSTCLQITAPAFVGLDESTTHIFLWIIYTVICQAVEVFGIVTNIINIICFVKQGLGDSINISLLGKGHLNAFFLTSKHMFTVCVVEFLYIVVFQSPE